MIANASPLLQTVLGTLFTWGLTALGSGVIFVTNSSSRKLLDSSLGFAAGVMTAASYWSLLAPAIDLSLYLNYGALAFLPASVGFSVGALFVFLADVFMPVPQPTQMVEEKAKKEERRNSDQELSSVGISLETSDPNVDVRRRPLSSANLVPSAESSTPNIRSLLDTQRRDVRRILLMVLAITIHNIPEGLAVGVSFGAVGTTKSASFESARNLAIGIGIQNFPEGLAVSLPLRASGLPLWKSFWYGQLSGLVEPLAGVFGCVAVQIAQPLLPYALAFAAGAMIFVVFDDIVPEATSRGNGRLASFSTIVGFVVMMILDVGLG